MNSGAAEVVVDPAPSLLRDGRAIACPLCGDAARYEPALGLIVCAGPECSAAEVLTVEEIEAQLEAAGRRWWQGLDGFRREVFSERSTENAARHLARGLLEKGIAPEVVEVLVKAVNLLRRRPALGPAIEEALLAAASDVGRRRKRAA